MIKIYTLLIIGFLFSHNIMAETITISDYQDRRSESISVNVEDKLIIEDNGTLVVNNLTVYAGLFREDGELTVKSGGTLIVYGDLNLYGDNIQFEEGSKIILEGKEERKLDIDFSFIFNFLFRLDLSTDLVINNPNFKLPSKGVTLSGDLYLNAEVDLSNTNLDALGDIYIGEDVKIENLPWLPSDKKIILSRLHVKNQEFYRLSRVLFVNNVLIEPNGELEIPGDITLKVSNDVVNDGTLIDLGGGIDFNGADQKISGEGTFQIQKLSVSNSDTEAGLQIEGNLEVSNYLKLNENALLNITNGTVKLISNGPEDYAILKKVGAGATIKGDIIYQKYIGSSDIKKNEWWHIGSTLQNVSKNDWKKNINFKKIYWYDEPKSRWSPANALEVGIGHTVTLYGSNFSNGSAFLEERGTPVIGDHTFKITKSGTYDGGGWNLIANPYACPIDWNSDGWNKENIDGSIYIWNAALGDYEEINPGIGNTVIPPGKAFWIKVSDPALPASLSVTEDAKVEDNTPGILRIANQESVLQIALIDPSLNDDKLYIRFKESATEEFDHHLDAYKMDGNYVSISFFTESGTELSINSLPVDLIRKNIKLNLSSSSKGTHRLIFEKSSFGIQSVILQDNYLDTMVDLDTVSQYNFEINSDAASYGSERFEIILTQQVHLSIEDQIGTYGEVVEVPVTVTNFEEVLTAQFGMRWDTDKLEFQSVSHFGMASLNESHFNVDSASGSLILAWDDANLAPQTVSDDQSLFVLEFLVKALPGSSTELSFDQGLIASEIAGADFQIISSRFINGMVQVASHKTISGSIKDIYGRPLTNVNILSQGDSTFTVETEENGLFQFDLQANHEVELSVEDKNSTDFTQGISTLDILLIRRHVLNTGQFDHELMQYAADVNGSGTVTSLDIALIRKMILGLANDFPVGKPWRFFSSINQNEHVTVTDADQSYDFTGVKLGDINNSWNETNQRVQFDQEMFVNVNDQQIRNGQEVVIPVTVAEFKEIAGYQFSMNWNQDILKFERIENVSLINNLNESKVTEGSIAIQWDHEQGEGISLEDGSVLFNLVFQTNAMVGSETTIEITSEISEASAFNKNLQQVGIVNSAARIKVIDELETNLETGIQLTNYPNPFQESTTISFQLKNESNVSLKIIDQQGRLIDNIRNYYSAGNHQLVWNTFGKTVNPGLYFIQMTTNGQQFTHKMIIR